MINDSGLSHFLAQVPEDLEARSFIIILINFSICKDYGNVSTTRQRILPSLTESIHVLMSIILVKLHTIHNQTSLKGVQLTHRPLPNQFDPCSQR